MNGAIEIDNFVMGRCLRTDSLSRRAKFAECGQGEWLGPVAMVTLPKKYGMVSTIPVPTQAVDGVCVWG